MRVPFRNDPGLTPSRPLGEARHARSKAGLWASARCSTRRDEVAALFPTVDGQAPSLHAP